jgi:hypothetical protein
LKICADGRVVAEMPEGLWSLSAVDLTGYAKAHPLVAGPGKTNQRPKIEVLEGKLPVEQLEGLLQFALHDQEFFDFERDAVMKKYHLDGMAHDGTDATTTTYRIRTADREHEVKWSRLSKTLWDFPEEKRLQQLYAVEGRLSQLYYILLAGGRERVEAVVPKMNELLRPYYRRFAAAPVLTAADLVAVAPDANGSSTQYTFARAKSKAVRDPLFEVTINVPEQGEASLCYVIPPRMVMGGFELPVSTRRKSLPEKGRLP